MVDESQHLFGDRKFVQRRGTLGPIEKLASGGSW